MRWLLLLGLAACDGSRATIVDSGMGNEEPSDGPPVETRFVAYVSGGADITRYDVDKTTGALTMIGATPSFRTGASFIAFRGTTHLYAVASGNRVGAYSIDPTTSAITFINDVDSGGNGPTHVSVDKTGQFVFVANYGGGNISVFPIQANGGLGTATQTLASGANAHLIDSDPSNKFVFVPCLGANYVAQYTLANGTLTANQVPTVATAAGAGPRHLAFAPNGTHVYLINELNSTLTALTLDTVTGRLTPFQTLSTRAAGATGTNTTAEVVVHPSGKFVYGSNRGDNNIVVFRLDAAGMMTLVGHTPTEGMTPRNFTIDPTGSLLYAANQNSGTVVPFKIDGASGGLMRVATSVNVPTPAFVGILALPL